MSQTSWNSFPRGSFLGRLGLAFLFLATPLSLAGTEPANPANLPPSSIQRLADYTVTLTRKNAWSGGYGGEITVVNNADKELKDWTLVFESPDVFKVFVGSMSKEGSKQVLKPSQWKTTLPPKDKFTAGFQATCPGFDWTPPITGTIKDIKVDIEIVDQATIPGESARVVILPDFESGSKLVNQITLEQGTTRMSYKLATDIKGPLEISNNFPETLKTTVEGDKIVVTTLKTEGDRACLRIKDTASGKFRNLGVRIKGADGKVPAFPPYVSIGVCSEDIAGDLKMFQEWGPGDMNRRANNRYIYLNGGPLKGWWTWTTPNGDRARRYIRNSLRCGVIPTFVWYNIPDGDESFPIDLKHMQDASYMKAYFELLKNTLKIFNEECPNETVMLVMEPDFIGYMMQKSGKQPTALKAAVQGPAQSAGIQKAGDPSFPDTLTGLVQAINHYIKRDCPQVRLGWQINVWSSPDQVPGGSLMKTTDAQGWEKGRAFIAAQATKVADYYVAAGITSKADFISFDKYGFDAAGADNSPEDPSKGNWFWNCDHWNNYLDYVKILHQKTGLPVALWQLPVGRINTSKAVNPYNNNGAFKPLDNSPNHFEDSSATFFFGDTFAPGNATRKAYFAKNQANDPGFKTDGDLITWGAHFEACKKAGVFNLMFGDGVSGSTRARPQNDPEPTDGWWLMTAAHRYLANPVPWKAPLIEETDKVE